MHAFCYKSISAPGPSFLVTEKYCCHLWLATGQERTSTGWRLLEKTLCDHPLLRVRWNRSCTVRALAAESWQLFLQISKFPSVLLCLLTPGGQGLAIPARAGVQRVSAQIPLHIWGRVPGNSDPELGNPQAGEQEQEWASWTWTGRRQLCLARVLYSQLLCIEDLKVFIVSREPPHFPSEYVSHPLQEMMVWTSHDHDEN